MIPTHPVGQEVLFHSTMEVSAGPLTITTTSYLRRVPRQKCSTCGNRRICFAIVSGNEQSAPMCAKCAGIR